jgi:hypothetical protein
MGMTRSDLPNVRELPPDVQRKAVDEMWRAYAKAEPSGLSESVRAHHACPISYVATITEMLEAGLAAIRG